MRIRVLGEDLGFTEGPTITSAGDVVVVSIDRGRLYHITGAGPRELVHLDGGPNGATGDEADLIWVAQNGGNWMRNPSPGRKIPGMSGGVQRVTLDGESSWLSRQPLAPNDICFGPDGWLYVTDPTRNGKYDDGRIWRCEAATGETELLARVGYFCNGIGFGLDDQLYVASSGDRRIIRYGVAPSGLVDEEIAVQMVAHAPDGFTFDIEGNLVIAGLSRSSRPGEIQVWTVQGHLVERVLVGDGHHYTNVALDGASHLVVTDSAGGRVVCVDGWPAPGLALHPWRRHALLASDLNPGLAGLDAGSALETTSP